MTSVAITKSTPRSLRVGSALAAVLAQGLSSTSNFLVGFLALAATGTDLEEFAYFAMAFQICQITIALAQGATGNALLVHEARTDWVERERFRSGAATAALLLGLAVGGVVALASFVVDRQVASFLLVVAFGGPGIVCQYSMRASFFARAAPGRVVVADAIWLGTLLFAALCDYSGVFDVDARGYLIAWVGGAWLSALPFVAAGLRGARNVSLFVRVTGLQAVHTGAEGLLARSTLLVSFVALERFGTPTAAGVFAAALLLFSPLSVAHAASLAVGVPTLIRQRGVHVASWRVPGIVIGLLVVFTTGWAGVLWLFGTSGAAFGPFDVSANGITALVFVAATIRFFALAAWRGPALAMRVADTTKELLGSRVLGTVCEWGLSILGAAIAGLHGGALGLAMGTVIGACVAVAKYEKIRHRDGNQ